MPDPICPQHHCPMPRIAGRRACLLEAARAALGLAVTDLARTAGQVVLLFPDGRALPLPGWPGNRRAADPAEAEALLDVLAGLVLVGADWQASAGSLELNLADPAAVGAGQSDWCLSLHPADDGA